MQLKDLKKLKPVKELKRGGKSKYVQLLQNNIIKKKYDRRLKNHKKHFEHELEILAHAANSNHVPTLLGIDRENFTIYMTYCGDTPKDSTNLRARVAALMKMFRDHYQLIRYELTANDDERKLKQTDWVELHNICEKDGHLYLIDFGSELWHLSDKSILPMLHL